MSTRHVVSGCCAAPLAPLRVLFDAEVVQLGCVACRTIVGTPGPEEGDAYGEAVREIKQRNPAASLISLGSWDHLELTPSGRVVGS